MSFLAGRLVGKEAAYFFQESKHAVNRLAEKLPATSKTLPAVEQPEAQADVLPEVLKHSLPGRIYGPPPDPSSISKSSKWLLQFDPNAARSVSPDAMNPLKAYVSLPQVTFGPKRWALPEGGRSVLASTANDLRRDRDDIPVNPEKLRAAAEGLQHVGKAFAVATIVVFGGAALAFGMAASELDIHHSDDIRTRGKDVIRPKFETIREQVLPLRTWVENTSRKWKLDKDEEIKEKPFVKDLHKVFGAKNPN